jgi:pimeloyl-ACP methyl ester carboxylesterase
MIKKIFVIFGVLLIFYSYYKYLPIKLTKDLIDWKKKGNFFRYNKNKIFYIDTKETKRDVILLLHGYPTSSYDFHKIFPKLNEKYRLVTLDYLGTLDYLSKKDMDLVTSQNLIIII